MNKKRVFQYQQIVNNLIIIIKFFEKKINKLRN